MDMMIFDQVVVWINSSAPAWLLLVLGGLGSLVVAGTAYVAVSPSKTDDAWLAKVESVPLVGLVLKLIKSFSFIKKDEGKVKLSNG
jgi:hypothetical protein